jgi:iron complex outermembrane receptor protein
MAFLFLLSIAALAQHEHCDTLQDNMLQEVTVLGRQRISPLHELTVEPLAWESSITYITADDNHKTAAHHLFDALKYSVNGVAST